MNRLIKKHIPFRIAVVSVVLLNMAVIVFHILVLVRIIPFDVVWGGRLGNIDEMHVFEGISIGVNVFLILTAATKANWLNRGIPVKLVNGILWVFVMLFALNTIGNLNAVTSLEMIIATPLTVLLAILCWRIAVE